MSRLVPPNKSCVQIDTDFTTSSISKFESTPFARYRQSKAYQSLERIVKR